MWRAQEKSEGVHQKNFGRRFAPALCPHLQIASDATGLSRVEPAIKIFISFFHVFTEFNIVSHNNRFNNVNCNSVFPFLPYRQNVSHPSGGGSLLTWALQFWQRTRKCQRCFTENATVKGIHKNSVYLMLSASSVPVESMFSMVWWKTRVAHQLRRIVSIVSVSCTTTMLTKFLLK